MHGLYCEEISEPLHQIRQFLDEHPKEFVVFDCQHFYNFSNGDYGRLEKILIKIFDQKLYKKTDGTLGNLTLSNALSMNRQLLVIYRYHNVPKEFWESEWWPTPWPNKICVDKLKNYLNWSLKNRSPETGYVNQCVLTPPAKYIIPRYVNVDAFFSNQNFNQDHLFCQ